MRLPQYLLATLAFAAFDQFSRADDAVPDFDRQVAPLLASRCLDCHAGAKPKGDLDLSEKKNWDSESVWQRVNDDEMPPKHPLSAAEKKTLRTWIVAGAKWGADPIDPFRYTSSSRAGYDWWSLQPTQTPKLPSNDATDPITAFVQEKLRAHGLSLAPEADRRTWIRRVYMDLIGLPPTPEEVQAFDKDNAESAYETVVDRLLASPHYGERWARHWMDVIRYGETDGFERNTPRPNAWQFRNWLIDAFNADMPFDQMARWQLAGDVLAPNNPDAIRATGFLVAGVHNTVLGNPLMREMARQDELEDLVGVVGQSFLGLTVQCARCHDHKFDPISQKDYYRIVAALSGVGFGERTLPNPKAVAAIAELEKDIQLRQEQIRGIEEPARQAVLKAKGLRKENSDVVTPIAAWDFRKSGDDLIGELDVETVGKVKFTQDGAVFDGKSSYLRTSKLNQKLSAKTLEAWVKLDHLHQRGGGVMSLINAKGDVFDAIVYGEQQAQNWMAGSDFFRRTQAVGGAIENKAALEMVHIAISYTNDGTIAIYRNGQPYGKSYDTDNAVTFASHDAMILFGCRHQPAGGNKMLAGTIATARLYDKVLSSEEIAASFESGSIFASMAEINEKLSPTDRDKRDQLRRIAQDLDKQRDDWRKQQALGKAYVNVSRNPGITRLLLRGDVTTPSEEIAPAGIHCLPTVTADWQLAKDANDADRRRKLADWITAAKNPLFPRVMANRVWHYHFGRGLVPTPSDFGFNGGRPSHPELLDWLANQLREQNYQLKPFHKQIVLSAVYRQSSQPNAESLKVDADNQWLWHFPRRRIEGEVLRDSLLKISGLLNTEVGGQGFSDYQTKNFNGTAYFEPFDPVGPEFHRRSVYRFLPRGGNPGFLEAFDCPDPATSAPRRARTTTPLQALSLWNSDFSLRMASALTERVTQEQPEASEQIQRLWELVYQRPITDKEMSFAKPFVKKHDLKALARVLINSNEFVTVE